MATVDEGVVCCSERLLTCGYLLPSVARVLAAGWDRRLRTSPGGGREELRTHDLEVPPCSLVSRTGWSVLWAPGGSFYASELSQVLMNPGHVI